MQWYAWVFIYNFSTFQDDDHPVVLQLQVSSGKDSIVGGVVHSVVFLIPVLEPTSDLEGLGWFSMVKGCVISMEKGEDKHFRPFPPCPTTVLLRQSHV